MTEQVLEAPASANKPVATDASGHRHPEWSNFDRAPGEGVKKKQPAAVQTSESIEEQTRLFLKSGNKIDVIKSGVSGQPTMAVNKQIKLGNKQKTG